MVQFQTREIVQAQVTSGFVNRNEESGSHSEYSAGRFSQGNAMNNVVQLSSWEFWDQSPGLE